MHNNYLLVQIQAILYMIEGKPKDNRKSKMMELEPLESASDLKQAELSFMQKNNSSSSDAFNTNINQSRIIKQLRIGLQSDKSALYYHNNTNLQFFKMIPIFLFSILKQLHTIYLIVIGVFMSLKFYCFAGFEWEILTTQIVLTLVYILIEFQSRSLTYKFYTNFQGIKTSQYQVWRNRTKQWHPIEERQLKVGQIIRIRNRKLKEGQEALRHTLKDQILNQSDNSIQQKVQIPVNILPLSCSSGEDFIQIDTFQMDKKQHRFNIEIDERFSKFIQHNPSKVIIQDPSQTDQIDATIGNCKINYSFFSSMSECFEAILQFQHLREEKKISNLNIIPRGAFFCNQQYIIGAVLYNLQNKNQRYLKYLLGSKNTISTHLQSHLIGVLMINVLGILFLLALNSILSIIKYGQVQALQFYCYAFNYISIFSFSMNAIMYILLGIHQLADSSRVSKKCSIKINNYIKTIDEFGMARTFIMDQFTFVRKNILAMTEMDINEEEGFEMFNEKIILYLIKNSLKFKQRFPNQWLSLSIHYKQKYRNNNDNFNDEPHISIEDEIIDISGAVRMIVSMRLMGEDNYERTIKQNYFVRFNQKMIFSILESISLEKKQYFAEKIQQGKKNGEMMIMVELLPLNKDYQVDLSINIYELQYKFYCLIRMKFLPQQAGTDFVKELENNYSIVIMTSSTFEYFDRILVTAGLKEGKCETIIFQETQQTIFRKQLETRTVELQHGQWSRGTQKTGKNLIIALDSSLTAYLARGNIRKMISQISKNATYLIFYNMSQFQKQLCAVNIFKIFPNHIFLSNFTVDSNLFRISNLSVSIEGYSANKLSTIIAKNYKQLYQFITHESVSSMQLTSIIVKNHIFKNQCLIASLLVAMLMVYEGDIFQLNLEYSTFIFFIYNAGFTMLPMLYYLLARPQLLSRIIIKQSSMNYNLREQHIYGILTGFLMTLISFSFIPLTMQYQLFVVVLINSTLMGNLYYLVVDNSVHKTKQIIVIIIQCIFAVGIIFIGQFIPYLSHNIFTFGIVMSSRQFQIVYYYIGVFFFNIWFILVIFYFMAFFKSSINRETRIVKKLMRKQGEFPIDGLEKNKLLGKVARSSGKQMRFRGFESYTQTY